MHLAEFCYNSSYNFFIKISPFMALYGYDAPNRIDLLIDDHRVPKENNFMQENQDIMKVLKNNIKFA